MSFPFNIRVYGALVLRDQLLLSQELILGKSVTKLPGGGLEFGEGLRDCLVREFMEETGLEVLIGDHIYTTDFFQISAFNRNHQVISVYYRVNLHRDAPFPETVMALEADQTFLWRPIHSLSENDFTLPIDRFIVPLLRGLHR